MAFFVDSVSKASKGQRTAPDWWHEVRREEQNQVELSNKSQKLFANLRAELFGDSTVKQSQQDASVETAADILKSFN